MPRAKSRKRSTARTRKARARTPRRSSLGRTLVELTGLRQPPQYAGSRLPVRPVELFGVSAPRRRRRKRKTAAPKRMRRRTGTRGVSSRGMSAAEFQKILGMGYSMGSVGQQYHYPRKYYPVDGYAEQLMPGGGMAGRTLGRRRKYKRRYKKRKRSLRGTTLAARRIYRPRRRRRGVSLGTRHRTYRRRGMSQRRVYRPRLRQVTLPAFQWGNYRWLFSQPGFTASFGVIGGHAVAQFSSSLLQNFMFDGAIRTIATEQAGGPPSPDDVKSAARSHFTSNIIGDLLGAGLSYEMWRMFGQPQAALFAAASAATRWISGTAAGTINKPLLGAMGVKEEYLPEGFPLPGLPAGQGAGAGLNLVRIPEGADLGLIRIPEGADLGHDDDYNVGVAGMGQEQTLF